MEGERIVVLLLSHLSKRRPMDPNEEPQEVEEDNEDASAEHPTLFDQDAPENA